MNEDLYLRCSSVVSTQVGKPIVWLYLVPFRSTNAERCLWRSICQAPSSTVCLYVLKRKVPLPPTHPPSSPSFISFSSSSLLSSPFSITATPAARIQSFLQLQNLIANNHHLHRHHHLLFFFFPPHNFYQFKMSTQVSGPMFFGGAPGGGGRHGGRGGRGGRGRGGIYKGDRQHLPRCLFCNKKGHVSKDCEQARRQVRDPHDNTLAVMHES